VLGPMGRNVADVCLLFAAQVGQHDMDPLTFPLEAESLAEPWPIDLGSLKVAYTEDFGGAPVEKGIRATFREKIKAMKHLFRSLDKVEVDYGGADRCFDVIRAVSFLSRYHDAYWAEIADVTTKDTGASLKEIFGEITRLQQQAPPEEELKGIQSYISGLFVIQNSSRQALIGQLRYVDLQGLSDDYLKTYVQKVNAVTPAQVQAMTAKYIKPESMTIVVVGDKSKITEQLKDYETK